MIGSFFELGGFSEGFFECSAECSLRGSFSDSDVEVSGANEDLGDLNGSMECECQIWRTCSICLSSSLASGGGGFELRGSMRCHSSEGAKGSSMDGGSDNLLDGLIEAALRGDVGSGFKWDLVLRRESAGDFSEVGAKGGITGGGGWFGTGAVSDRLPSLAVW